jgi:hypothetical protein
LRSIDKIAAGRGRGPSLALKAHHRNPLHWDPYDSNAEKRPPPFGLGW